MHRAKLAVTLLASLTLTVGCSGSDPYVAPNIAPSAVGGGITEDESASDPSPLEGLSAIEVWNKTKADIKDAKSVHVTAKALDGKDKIEINLKLADSGNATGSVTINGDEMTIRRLGKTGYFKGDSGFWTSNADAATAKVLANKWIKSTKGASSDMDEFFELTELDAMLKEALKMTASERKTLELAPGIEIAGQETVGLTVKSDEFDLMYIAADDPALPLNIAMSDDKTQYTRFRDWNESFKVVAPTAAINLDKAS